MRVQNTAKDVSAQNFRGLYNSKLLKKGLEFAADNGALFSAATCVVLSTVARPAAILLTPKAKKEDKQYACTRSIISGLLGFGIMAAISVPIAKTVNNIKKSPDKFLKKVSLNAFKDGAKTLGKSKSFQFATQMIKLASAFLTAIPKSYLTCAFVPPLMEILFNKKVNTNENTKISGSKVSFKGNLKQNMLNKFSKTMGKIFDFKPFQKFSNKFKDTNFAQHMFVMNDILLTFAFVKFTKDNPKIDEKRKNTLCNNAIITTGLTIPISYCADRLTKKPTEKFIEKFKFVNKGDKKLGKYLEGIKIAKPALIMGALYYIAAPVVATFLADSTSKKGDS